MPKFRRVRSLSLEQSRTSPCILNSRDDERYKRTNPTGSGEDVKEWNEIRCSICMEPPHNAVLLRCSSYEKGCRPYMCNTSHRQSNCLDQFCKSSAPYLRTTLLQEIPLTDLASHRQRNEPSSSAHTWPSVSQMQQKLLCPLCRGEIDGYVVIQPARQYMNSKVRSCSCETCEFSGTYPELRKHARSEHPTVFPSEVNPARQLDWQRLERERDVGDILSIVQAGYSDGDDNDIMLLEPMPFDSADAVAMDLPLITIMSGSAEPLFPAYFDRISSALDSMETSFAYSADLVLETETDTQRPLSWSGRYLERSSRYRLLPWVTQTGGGRSDGVRPAHRLRWRNQTSMGRRERSLHGRTSHNRRLRWRNQMYSSRDYH